MIAHRLGLRDSVRVHAWEQRLLEKDMQLLQEFTDHDTATVDGAVIQARCDWVVLVQWLERKQSVEGV